MSFLCTIRNKEVSYHQCVNECQYFFKSGCIDKMNEAYNQGRADAIDECIKVVDSVGYIEDYEYINKLEQLKECNK